MSSLNFWLNNESLPHTSSLLRKIKIIGKATLYCIEKPPLATAVSFYF